MLLLLPFSSQDWCNVFSAWPLVTLYALWLLPKHHCCFLNMTNPRIKYERYPSLLSWDIVYRKDLMFDFWWSNMTSDFTKTTVSLLSIWSTYVHIKYDKYLSFLTWNIGYMIFAFHLWWPYMTYMSKPHIRHEVCALSVICNIVCTRI